MTRSERAEWKSSVHNDADAQQFIAKFLAARDAGFPAMVAERAAAADKHLTVAGRAGSLTTRGKIAILLGPPAAFGIVKREVKGKASLTAGSAAGVNMGMGGASVADMNDAAVNAQMNVKEVHDYTFTYQAGALPAKQAKDFIVTVEVDLSDGSDKINDRRIAAQLEDQFEAAAAASRLTK